MRTAAIACSVILVGITAGIALTEGNSVIPFAMLTVCTPLLSLMALPGGSRRATAPAGRPAPPRPGQKR